MTADDRAPYGSKRLKIVLAALELYEFTRQQIVRYADVKSTDFDNAKRPDGSLALGKVLVELDTIQVGRGRAQKVYTFRSPEIYEQVSKWVRENYLPPQEHDLLNKDDDREASGGLESGEAEGDTLLASEADPRDLERILLFVGNLAKQEEEGARDFQIWLSRALRRASRQEELFHSTQTSIEYWDIDSLDHIQHSVQVLRMRYFLALDKSDDLRNLLNEILDICQKLGTRSYLVEYSGLIEVGLSIIDNLFMRLQENIDFKAGIQNLSVEWKRGQLEEWASRLRRVVFVPAIGNGRSNWLIERLLTYWVGWYERVLDSYVREPSEQQLLVRQLSETVLNRKRQSRDELRSMLELIDKGR